MMLCAMRTSNLKYIFFLQLRVSKEYLWSKREMTKEGAPLMELVELGIGRVKYASECVIALIKEIKAHSTQGRYVYSAF
jgi:small subunit ribosomal protein S29